MLESQKNKIIGLNRDIASRMDKLGGDKCFGDTELIELQRKKEFAENELVEMEKTYKECKLCDGDGLVDHECDCKVCCENVEECDECNGERVVPK